VKDSGCFFVDSDHVVICVSSFFRNDGASAITHHEKFEEANARVVE